jgi:branched-chain amino acid transport system permease protein
MRRILNNMPNNCARTGLFVLLLLLAACEPVDRQQAALCERLLPALAPTAIDPVAAEHDGAAVTLVFRVAGERAPRRLTCQFAGRAGADRRALIGVALEPASDGTGALSPARLAMLQIWLGLDADGPAAEIPAVHAPVPGALAYLAQLLINGLVLGAIYSLIAVGFAQVFSLLEIVNFAFGELYMVGAYIALFCLVPLAGSGLDHGLPALLAALVAVVALSLPWGWAIERLVYRPLRGPLWQPVGPSGRLIPLVSAIGLSIALQNLVLVTQGGRNKFLAPVLDGALTVPLGDGARLRIGAMQLVIVGLAASLCAALWLVSTRTSFGRQQRACAQDRGAAALLGVDIDRVIARSFMLSAALAAVAGLLALAYWGEADPMMGVAIGFKALTAAVLGGIGSLGGAMAGGLLIGLAEALWAGYFDGAYRDVVIFAALIVMLIARPAGLFGDSGKTNG